MKKLIVLLFFTVFSYSQSQEPFVYFSFGADIKNGIVGSEPTQNKPELNFITQFTMVGNNSVEIGIGYEEFKAINFSRYFISSGYRFKVTEKLKIIPTIEPCIINRWGDWGNSLSYNQKASFLSLGGAISIQQKVSEDFSLGLTFHGLLKPDTKMMYGTGDNVYSIYFKINYEIKL